MRRIFLMFVGLVAASGGLALIWIAGAAPAYAAQVYPGCAVPAPTPKHVFYIDPVTGSDATGNGSRAAPWRTLQAVVSSVNGASPLLSTVPYHHRDATGAWTTSPNPNAPIKPGDEILLMSGNYGAVSIGEYHTLIDNPQFVTVAAAPGQRPVLSSLSLTATNNWVFSGLTVQSLATPTTTYTPLVGVADQGPSYPTHDIIFQNMTLSSQNDISSWSQAQWRALGRDGIGLGGSRSASGANTRCISVSGSHIYNVKFGASITADQTLFTDNQIDHFGDDALDYAASDLMITHNYIHDNSDIGDGNHEDAMQGQIGRLAPGSTLNRFRNILIDGNVVIRQTDPHLRFPTYLQGIDAFDEDWTDVTVSNNVVITSACWGIAYSSLHDSIIVNNTVLADGLIPTAGGCKPSVSIGDKTHEGPSSSDSVVRNNLADGVSADNLDPGVEADHNVVVTINGADILFTYANGKPEWISKPGKYFNGNIIDSGGAASEFVDFDPAVFTYDVMLRAAAPAIGAGIAAGSPAVDILGFPRRAPYDAGAYSYPDIAPTHAPPPRPSVKARLLSAHARLRRGRLTLTARFVNVPSGSKTAASFTGRDRHRRLTYRVRRRFAVRNELLRLKVKLPRRYWKLAAPTIHLTLRDPGGTLKCAIRVPRARQITRRSR